jgi:two-component system sensor histidine kinase ChvG
MAIQTERPLSRGPGEPLLSSTGAAGLLGKLRYGLKRLDASLRWAVRRIGLYEFLTNGPLIRLVARTLWRRILFANLIGFAVLLVGIFYLGQYHAWLIEAKRDSLMAQGEVIAAAIAANATREKGTGRIIISPDMLPEIEGARGLTRDENIESMQLSIPPERVAPLLKGSLLPKDVRARVYDSNGVLIADSERLLKSGQLSSGEAGSGDEDWRPDRVKNAWTRLLSWMFRRQMPVYLEIGGGNGLAYPEVRIAVTGGQAAAMVLVNDEGEQIVSVATPVHYRGDVRGALLLSTKPGVIDAVLQEERNLLTTLALVALAATLIASLLLYRTIAGPMRRLSAAAEDVSHSIGARAHLPALAGRHDEIGQMSVAFRTMTESLFRRIEASERFAREVAHELKNPLTAARSTAEAMAYAKTPEMREELVRQIQGELIRLNKLISDVSDVSRLDAELAYGEKEPVDVRDVVHGIVAVFQDRLSTEDRKVAVAVQDVADNPLAFIVMGHEARLGRVITNLIDNALSFSPQGGTVTVNARRDGPMIELVVDDEGPGIPAENLENIFERFYSDRPQSDSTRGKNSGLGLSISRDIVNAYGGTLHAMNRMADAGAPSPAVVDQPALKSHRQPGVLGARFVVRLPAAMATFQKGASQSARRT